MANTAKVTIQGDATGAAAASAKASEGLAKVGATAKAAGTEATRAADQSASAEKKFEQEVQKSIQRLKQKETTAKATAVALRRMADEGNRAAAAGGEGGVRAGQVVAGFGKVGGAAGGALAGLGGAMNAGAPVLAAAGAALVLKTSLEALTAASDRRVQQETRIFEVEHQRKDAMQQARDNLGRDVIATAQSSGQPLLRAAVAGVGLDQITGAGQRTGASGADAIELSTLTAGLGEDIKAKIEQAFRDARYLGGSGVDAARALSAQARDGGLGSMSRIDLARAGLGAEGDQYSDQHLARALGPNSLSENIISAQNAGSSVDRAHLEALSTPGAFSFASNIAANDASTIRDPVTAALQGLHERYDRQIDLLERQASVESELVGTLKDLAAKIGRGQGSFATQAKEARESIKIGWGL